MNYPKYYVEALIAISWLGLHTWAAATVLCLKLQCCKSHKKTNVAKMSVFNSDTMLLLLLLTMFKAISAVKATTIKLFKPPFAMTCQ